MASHPDFDPDYVSPSLCRLVSPSLGSVSNFDAGSAITAIAAGGVAILADGSSDDSQISLIAAARDIDAAIVNFMARNGRGLICMPIASEQACRIGLTPMAGAIGNNPRCPGFSRSIEARSGVSTGISAHDRARTMSVAAAADACACDIVSPGHVFPIIGHENGLLGRCGAEEAAIELVRLAGRGFAAVLCRILRDDGEVATVDDIPNLGWMRPLEAVDIGTLLAGQCARTRLVHRDDALRFMEPSAPFQLRVYREQDGGRLHYGLLHGSRTDRDRSVIRICRDGDAGQNIHTVAALAIAIGDGVSEPGASLILVSGRERGFAGDIVNEAIGREILEDLMLNG